VDQDWAVITKINWQHDATIPAAQAVPLLQGLKCNLSRSLHAEVQQAQPQVVQVWFEPSPRPATGAPGGPDRRRTCAWSMDAPR
jgi:hypothetical protein